MNTSRENPEQDPEPAPAPETPTPPPPGAPAEPPNPGSAPFFHWLRGLEVQRGSNRWVGGVCSGLAAKWNIDPVIVRGLAIVLTLFFGVGLLAYGVAWTLLPEPDGRIHGEEVMRGRWSTGMTGATVVTLLGLAGPGQGFIFGGNDGGFPWPLFWIAGVAGIIYWAVSYNKTPAGGIAAGPPDARQQKPDPQDVGQRAAYFTAPAPAAGPRVPYTAQQPFVPNPQMYLKHQPVKLTPRLGAPASLLAIGMAAVVGAAMLLLDATNIIDLNGYQAGIAAAAAAITVGIAIVIAGIVGRSAGGLGAFTIVMLVFAAALSLPAQTGPFTSFNNTTWVPATTSVAESGQTVVLGNATFDLSKLDDGPGLSSELTVPLKTVAANVTLRVPVAVPVTIKSELAAVSLSVDGERDGQTLSQDLTTTLNQSATGPGIVINLQAVASTIEIVTVK